MARLALALPYLATTLLIPVGAARAQDAVGREATASASAPVDVAPAAPRLPPPNPPAPDSNDDDDYGEGDPNAGLPTHSFSTRVMAGVQYEHVQPQGGQQDVESTTVEPFLRQARIKAKVKFTKALRANLSLELSDGLRPRRGSQVAYLRNAYLQVRFDDLLQLRAGHLKRPYSRLELTSVNELPFRGRGLLNGLVIEDQAWGDRGVGAVVSGKHRPSRLKWYLGASQAAWASSGSEEPRGYTLHARLEYKPFKRLSFGAGGGHKFLNHDDIVAGTSPDTTRLSSGSVDVQLRTKRLHVMVEALAAQRRVCGASVPLLPIDCAIDADLANTAGELRIDADTPVAAGVVAFGAYAFRLSRDLALQPVVLGEYADADRSVTRTEALRMIGGANLLWGEHMRVMVQLEVVEPLGSVRDDTDRPRSRPVNPWQRSQTAYVMLTAQM